MRVSCKARQAGPGTGSADSCHRSPETARGLQEGKGGGGGEASEPRRIS